MKAKALLLVLLLLVSGAFVVSSSDARPNKPKKVVYVFKGIYQGDGQVLVKNGNAWVKKNGLKNKTVTFDFSKAKLSVADTNLSGTIELEDVQMDDNVIVKSKLPKKAPAEPLSAFQLNDTTNPPPACEDGEENCS